MKRFYLDWNATAPLLPEVKDAMIAALESSHGNASSIHQEGQTARAIVERARRSMAQACDTSAGSIVFTSGATEANNQVLRMHAKYGKKPFIVCSSVEHPSVIEVVEELGKVRGVRSALIPVDSQGRLDLDALRALLEQGVTFVSVMYANNEIGNVYPVREVAKLAHAHGALCHVDATQALGRLPLSFRDTGADIMTLSTHKMGGPKGVGVIITREGLVVEAMLAGGHQERGRRPGTENVPVVAGVDAAASAVLVHRARWTELMERRRAHFLELLDTHLEGLFTLRGDQENRLPNTVNVAFDGVSGEDALLSLDLAGVSASSGSACTAGSIEPSHVVLAMGYDSAEAKRSVRFSFGPAEGVEDLDEAVACIAKNIKRLQGHRVKVKIA